MKEKINKIYDSKAIYYNEIIEKFNKKNVNYILLNFIFPDNNPGDLDIMVNLNEKDVIETILKNSGFSYYTKFNTNQLLWNKYIEDVGFVQFHLYFGLSFMNQVFFKKIPDLSNKNFDNEFQFFVFLVESFFRDKFKKDIFLNYLKVTSFQKLYDFQSLYSPKSRKFIDNVILSYENKTKPSKLKTFCFLGFFSFFKLFGFYFQKIIKKISRYGNKSDEIVFVIGVDGAGKSTLIKNIHNILSKGGIFPKLYYFGLRKSFFYQITRVKKNKKQLNNNHEINFKIKSKSTKKINSITIFKILIYWIEYNILLLKRTYLMPNSAKTIYIFDRSFIDLIYYHPNNFTEKLFLKYSFSPTKLILITGQAELLHQRKNEYSMEVLKDKIKFYNSLVAKYKTLKLNTLTIDSSISNEVECKFIALNFILNED